MTPGWVPKVGQDMKEAMEAGIPFEMAQDVYNLMLTFPDIVPEPTSVLWFAVPSKRPRQMIVLQWSDKGSGVLVELIRDIEWRLQKARNGRLTRPPLRNPYFSTEMRKTLDGYLAGLGDSDEAQ